MNKIKKYEMPILISISILVFIALVSVSYAYFKARINNIESVSTIAFTSGEMTINYENNSAVLTGKNIKPGWSTTKTFTLNGKNDSKPTDTQPDNNMYYKIGIAVDINTFTQDAITYLLEKDSASSTNGQMQEDTIGTVQQIGTKYIGKGYFAETSTFVSHIYKLTISFPNKEENQYYDNDKKFAAHVVIEKQSSSAPISTTFASDSWETIAAVIQNGQLDAYPVGSEKEVEIGGNSYTVRVANNTTPEECNGVDFSQTACGFVVEFVDIVENRQMNSTSTNIGGWPATPLRTYANGEFFNKLPSDLQKVIIDTKVISGHGSTEGETNFLSTDKIYLLSPHEVYEAETNDQVSTSDTAWNNTRQLDYYASQGVTTDNYSGAIKQYNSSNSIWWLRTASTNYNDVFFIATITFEWTCLDANYTNGFAPGFRIG